MLCRAVPFLQLLTETFTAPEAALRIASFSVWSSFMDCCAQKQLLFRKRQVRDTNAGRARWNTKDVGAGAPPPSESMVL